MKTKIFTLFTALTLSAGALFASTTAVDGIYYNFDKANLTATVTYRGSSYDQYANEYKGNVVIPATVTYGSNTYSVTSIGKYAFEECSGLTSVTIPNSVTSIGSSAFSGCSGLTSVVWNAKNCADFKWYDNGMSPYSDAPFYYIASQITSFTFGSEVEHIPALLCFGMKNLTSVTIPNSVTSIGDGAFCGCSGLTSVTIPNSVTSIGDGAFNGCSGLTSVVWHANANYSDAPFYYIASQITSFTFGSEVEHIPAGLCFGMENLTSVTIPNSVTSIGELAFGECSGLTSVVWHAKNCADFAEYYDEYDNKYYYGPFDNSASQITSFTFGSEVEHIPAYLCYGMENLTSVTIPNSVTSIGNEAFAWCSGLTKTNYTGDIAGWCGINFGGWGSNPTTYSHNLYINNVEVKDLVIPNSVTSIGDGAFCGCSGLTSVTIPNSVTSIGNYAFYGCSELTAISTPNSVKTIAKKTFADCTKLKTVVIGNAVTNIGDSAFYGCDRLLYLSSYAEEPPFVGTDPFSTYNVYLKVPCSSLDAYKMYAVWRDFNNISCIGSETVDVTEFSVTPSTNEAQFTWPAEPNAATYELVISKDGVVFCTLTFNASGQLMGIAFAPGANSAATTATSGFQFTVTGLDEASHYTYTFDAKDAGGSVVKHYAGEFNTDGFVGLGQIELEGLYTQAGRIVCEGEFRIYDLLGRDVTRLNGSLCGVYVVKTANAAQKVVVK